MEDKQQLKRPLSQIDDISDYVSQVSDAGSVFIKAPGRSKGNAVEGDLGSRAAQEETLFYVSNSLVEKMFGNIRSQQRIAERALEAQIEYLTARVEAVQTINDSELPEC